MRLHASIACRKSPINRDEVGHAPLTSVRWGSDIEISDARWVLKFHRRVRVIVDDHDPAFLQVWLTTDLAATAGTIQRQVADTRVFVRAVRQQMGLR